MNIDDKKAFRKAMLLKRDALPYENRIEADEARNECIRNWDVYQNAELLLFYVSYRSEADTIQLIKEALAEGRKVAVPKVIGKDMIFYRITEFSQLIEGYKGILEPDIEKAELLIGVTDEQMSKNDLAKHTLLFVPGCAFDVKGGRMGYGGGFYDRFMEKYPDVLKVALAYEEQMVPEVPREAHDKTVDVIMTEERKIEMDRTYGARGTRAKELFLEGYNCAQAVVLAYEDYFDESPETLAQLVSAFGGGMGRLREVCGSVSGMFFVLSKVYGYADPKEKDGKMDLYARVQELAARFRERNGSIVCRELLGLAEKVSVPVPEERTPEYYKKRPCPDIIADAADILEEYLREQGKLKEAADK